MPAIELVSQPSETAFAGVALTARDETINNTESSAKGLAANAVATTSQGQADGTGKVSAQPTATSSNSAIPQTLEHALTHSVGENTMASPFAQKPASIGGKSIASAVTFAMDEKESLRPDDSASIAAAAEDEELRTGRTTGVLDSSSGSNEDVRAFREQLEEISAIDPLRRASVTGIGQEAAAAEVLYVPSSDVALAGMLQHAATVPYEAPPDYKLIEALENPRDRIWVLKLEQDVIDFVKDTKESSLVLPQCNSFYRMLAHKIADYYMLGHSVDDSSTAVRLFKTAHCRIVRPLTGVVTPSTAASTPPPPNVHMKILRRGIDASGPLIANGSNVPIKSVSESGEDDDKRAVTREEREARYEAARLRIMGSAKPVESDMPSERDESRSSSVSRKGRKSRRDNSDDDFDSRSAYNSYFTTGYPQASVYSQQYSAQPPVQPGQVPTYPQYAPQAPQFWYPQGMQVAEPLPQWSQAQSPGFDLAREFDRSMSFQTQPPAPYSAPHSPYGQTTFPGGPLMSQYPWPPTAAPSNINPMQPYTDRPASSGSQAQATYAYGRLPSQALGRPPNALEHPLPGSYKSRHFNPQSQTFIPGHGDTFRPFMPQRTMSGPDVGLNVSPGSIGLKRQMSQHSQSSQFSSPSRPHGTITARHPPQGMTHPLPQPVFTPQAPPSTSLPPKPYDAVAGGSSGAQGDNTIAKWGTPASLPAKPPPTAADKHSHTPLRGSATSSGHGSLNFGSMPSNA